MLFFIYSYELIRKKNNKSNEILSCCLIMIIDSKKSLLIKNLLDFFRETRQKMNNLTSTVHIELLITTINFFNDNFVNIVRFRIKIVITYN